MVLRTIWVGQRFPLPSLTLIGKKRCCVRGTPVWYRASPTRCKLDFGRCYISLFWDMLSLGSDLPALHVTCAFLQLAFVRELGVEMKVSLSKAV